MRLLYASSNPGKLAEFALAAAQYSSAHFQVLPLPGLKQIAPPEETGVMFEEIAAAKALYYSRFTSELVFADDSGLEVDALGGAPGVLSARFAGVDATDEQNNSLLLKSLSQTQPRSARFVTALALVHAGRVLSVAHGRVEGSILQAPQGTRGFGYDPLFLYPPLGKSFAELSDEQKLEVSARGQAARSLFGWLASARL